MISAKFHYNDKGRGTLKFTETVEERSWDVSNVNCRTGSVNPAGELVNACPPGAYVLQSKAEPTNEQGMRFDGKIGLKTRLYRVEPDGSYKYTHLLIHFDEGANGTKGCIGTVQPVPELYEMIDGTISLQGKIKLEVSRD